MSDNAAYFYNKINEDLRRGGTEVRAEDNIDIIDGYKGGGYGVSIQHELGGQDWGIDVKADDIIDIIDGYKGRGYGVSIQHELGAGQDWEN